MTLEITSVEILPSDSLPSFPMDDDSESRLEDASDLARTIELRPMRHVSPDNLCEIGVRASLSSSAPLWNIKAAWPGRAPMPTVAVRERSAWPWALPVAASVGAFALTLIVALAFRGQLEALVAALLGG